MAYARKTWGARGTVPRDNTPKTKLYIHHTAALGGGVKTLAQQRARMRQYENQHIRQGWSTIGYSFVVFQPHGPRLKVAHGYVGRGWAGLPAAQAKANSGTIAVCIDGNFQTETIDPATLARLIAIAKRAKARGINTIGGHRDAPRQSTACPGNNLQQLVPRIGRAAGLRVL